MKFETKVDGVWYHGSNEEFEVLREGSIVSQWKELAVAYAHKPSVLSFDEEGVITHNGTEKGYLYVIDEPVMVDVDVFQHSTSFNDAEVEFLTKRPLKVKLVEVLDAE